jgi:3-carboxy-cis,cis-muconate cycloisomerase
VQEDERGLGNWHAEWETLPEIFRLTGGALHQIAETVPHLELDSERMRHNLEATRGLIYAEGVATALGTHLGKSEGHRLVEAAAKQARESGTHLREVLSKTKAVTEHLTSADLDQLFAPENYLGTAKEFTDRVIVASRFASQTASQSKK